MTKINGFWVRSADDGKFYLYDTFTGRWHVMVRGKDMPVRAAMLPDDVAALDKARALEEEQG